MRSAAPSLRPLRLPGLLLAAAVAFASAAGCNRPKGPEPEHVEPEVAAPPSAPLQAPLSRPASERLVAIGDLHGDLDHARRALRLAGAIDAHDQWIGGRLVVVQTGDEIDRGDDDRAILDLVEALSRQASAAGGEFIALLGNHEVMNAASDFRYVTPAGFTEFAQFAGSDAAPPDRSGSPATGRRSAFGPGGVYAELLSHRPIVFEVGDTVFVHGGVLPKHVAYGLRRMNDELDDWLHGKRANPPSILVADDGPIWTRAYSAEDATTHCSELSSTLQQLAAKRMVVGHTVQRGGINSACGGAVWRIDVGLSRYFGGPVEALEIREGKATVLREN